MATFRNDQCNPQKVQLLSRKSKFYLDPQATEVVLNRKLPNAAKGGSTEPVGGGAIQNSAIYVYGFDTPTP